LHLVGRHLHLFDISSLLLCFAYLPFVPPAGVVSIVQRITSRRLYTRLRVWQCCAIHSVQKFIASTRQWTANWNTWCSPHYCTYASRSFL